MMKLNHILICTCMCSLFLYLPETQAQVLEHNPFLAPAPLATGSSPTPAYGAPATLPVPLMQRLYPLSYA